MKRIYFEIKNIYIYSINIYRLLLFSLFLFHLKFFHIFKISDQNKEKWNPVKYQRWQNYFNLLATDFFFQILAHPVFKMRVIQKPNKVPLWNKQHFEGEKMEIIEHV